MFHRHCGIRVKRDERPNFINRTPGYWVFFALISGFIMGACSPLVPATTPPQLDHTPGAFVIVTEDTFDGGIFRVDYPSSWRIVKTSIAGAENLQVVFVSPDDHAITLTQVDSVSAMTNENEQFITLDNGVVIQVIVAVSEENILLFEEQANRLIGSVRAANE